MRKVYLTLNTLIQLKLEPGTTIPEVIDELDYSFFDGTGNAEIEDSEIRSMELKGEDKAKVNFYLIIRIDEGIEISHFVHELTWRILDTTEKATLLDVKTLDFEVTDSK